MVLEKKSTDLPTRHLGTGIRQTNERDPATFQFVGTYNANIRVSVGHLRHAPDAIRKDPIVRLHDLAIFALGRDAGKRVVVVLDLGKE